MTAIAAAYPDDIRAMLDGLTRFVEREVIGRHEKHSALLESSKRFGADGYFKPEVVEIIRELRIASAEAGYYTLAVPEALGGGGMGLLAYFAAWHEIVRRCGGKNWLYRYAIAHWATGPSPVLAALSEAMRGPALADLMSGRKSLCFCLSEPGAGSDAASIATRAVRDGEGFRITGQKIWITNAPHADYAIVFAVTNPERAAQRKGGISAFFVPTASKGFTVASPIKMFDAAGGDEGLVHLDDIYAGPDQLMGKLDQGFAIGLQGVTLGRVYNCARASGMGRWALEEALSYAKQRKTFGRDLSDYQGIMFPLAEAALGLHAGHLMALNAARLLDQGQTAVKEMSMAKVQCVTASLAAIDRAIQTHGALGLTNEMGFTAAYSDMRKIQIADGTNEILLRGVANQLLKGDVEL